MTKHFSEAELLETYYMQPGESMPVMMHLASCTDCAAKYERLERKLREAASCSTEKPATFWSRQRASIMRRIPHRAPSASPVRTWRIAAATILAFFLGGALVYKSVEPELKAPTAPPVAVASIVPSSAAEGALAEETQLSMDAWQSDELQNFQPVVQWESWVAETAVKNGDASL
jgi:hypothetical protein